MSSVALSEGLALIAAGLDKFAEVDCAGLALRERLNAMNTLETGRRRELAVFNAIAATVADLDFSALGDTPKKLIADTVRITLPESASRLTQAELVRERTTLTGEPLPPHLPTTAQLWNQGLLDAEHVAEIIRFFKEIPADTPYEVREDAEKFLAEKALEVRPDQLKRLAKQLALTINPDGIFSDKDRRQQSEFHWTSQRADGMSRGVLTATPELRAQMDAFFAKYGAPGMCLPDDDEDFTAQPADDPAEPGAAPPCDAGAGSPQHNSPAADAGDQDVTDLSADTAADVDEQDVSDHTADPAADATSGAAAPAADQSAAPDDACRRGAGATADPDHVAAPEATSNDESTPEATSDAEAAQDAAADAAVSDYRTQGQRKHDALTWWMRAVLGNPALGTHRGRPLTVVVTVTLGELLALAGVGRTTGGTVIPMRNLLRMASQGCDLYLEVFADGDRRVLDLFRAQRCANGDQWLALFGRDKGCTKPNCDKPPDDCQAHHSPDYADDGQTNINMMGLACFVCHPQVKPDGWSTTMRGGTTEWEPPPQYPRKAPKTNNFHHPEEYLRDYHGGDAEDDTG